MKKVTLNQWFKLNKNDVKNPESTLEQATPWIPKEGEWCLFWTSDENKPPILSKFFAIKNGCYTESLSFTSSVFCEPFIGELPSYLR